jgi:hypothetical protein
MLLTPPPLLILTQHKKVLEELAQFSAEGPCFTTTAAAMNAQYPRQAYAFSEIHVSTVEIFARLPRLCSQVMDLLTEMIYISWNSNAMGDLLCSEAQLQLPQLRAHLQQGCEQYEGFMLYVQRVMRKIRAQCVTLHNAMTTHRTQEQVRHTVVRLIHETTKLLKGITTRRDKIVATIDSAKLIVAQMIPYQPVTEKKKEGVVIEDAVHICT